jgi:hypothetical protein
MNKGHGGVNGTAFADKQSDFWVIFTFAIVKVNPGIYPFSIGVPVGILTPVP